MFDNIEYDLLNYLKENIQSPIMDKLMVFFTTLGDNGNVWIIICALLLISKKTRYISMIALVALLFGNISTYFLKNILLRPRPFINIPNLELLVKPPTTYSMPSLHTTLSFAASGTFGTYFGKVYAIFGYLLAIMISVSRIYLYVHYPTDVLFGILLGLTCSLLAIVLFNRYKSYQENKNNITYHSNF